MALPISDIGTILAIAPVVPVLVIEDWHQAVPLAHALVAVYGYRLPPYGVRAAVSEDEGQTWQPEIIVRDDGGSWDLGYPQAVESSRGKVMVAYYFNSRNDRIQADGGVRHIARTIFTPD